MVMTSEMDLQIGSLVECLSIGCRKEGVGLTDAVDICEYPLTYG
jgi:hypothetical protein